MRISSSLALFVALSAAIAKAAPTEPKKQYYGKPLNVIETVRKIYSSKYANEAAAPAVENLKLAEPTRFAYEGFKAAHPAAHPAAGGSLNSTLSFAGKSAAYYNVGNNIPGIPFALPNSWAGLVPINQNAELDPASVAKLKDSNDPSLFFWLWGAETDVGKDDLVVWFNGGPGCSSLSGFLEENGPIRWLDKTKPPQKAADSWTREANVIWVEQPLGTGFTRGKPTATNEDDVARQFYGFMTNLYKIFPELKGKKLWIAAESYGGLYAPYTSAFFYKQKDNFNLQGFYIVDGVITDQDLQQDVVIYDYILAQNKYLKFTDAQIARVKADSDKCGYTNYLRDNLHYPPKSHPLPSYKLFACGGFADYEDAAMKNNKKFNIYNIAQPGVFDIDPLGDPNNGNFQFTYFDRKDVQDYIHAPHINWTQCAHGTILGSSVFPDGDSSQPPDQTVLAGVIEKSKRTVIAHGLLDGLLLSNGSALALQNLTWHDKQGFQQAPKPLPVLDGKPQGTYNNERNLLFAMASQSGHMLPEDAPQLGLLLLRWMLGRAEL